MNEQLHFMSSVLARGLLMAVGLVLLLLCVGFIAQWSWVVALWPWPDSRLSYRFLAAIMAAIAMPILWIGWSQEIAAVKAGALDFAVNYTLLGVLVWWFREELSEWVSVPMLISICVLAVLLNAWLYVRARQVPFSDNRPVPALLSGSFLLFALVLIAVGIALIMDYPGIFPWPLSAQTAMVFGCIALGAAAYFIHGFVVAVQGNIRGQLLGFLAYDAILLMPLWEHIRNVAPEHQLSLMIYLGVLVYSAVLAVYYLFIYPQTRFRWGQA